MVAYRRDEIVSATELARNLSSTLASLLDKSKEKIAIAKNNKLEAVILDIEEYERLKEAAELLEHIEIGKIVEARKGSATVPFEKLLADEGIDYDDL
ncbi:type II toxin-antitoxin system Phd/YefM family antitoxin [Hydrogenimonas sp.]